MELVLKLDKTQGALLTALNRAGAAKTSLQEIAMRTLDEGIRSEAKRRRLNSEAVLAVSLSAAAERKRKERDASAIAAVVQAAGARR